VRFPTKETTRSGGSLMDQGKFSTAERDALQYWRFHHPRPQVQRKMEVLYLKSQGVSVAEVCRLCAIAPSTYRRYLRAYRSGGIAKLQAEPGSRRPSELADYRVLIGSSPPVPVKWLGSRRGT